MGRRLGSESGHGGYQPRRDRVKMAADTADSDERFSWPGGVS
jgi:hypothetical protein